MLHLNTCKSWHTWGRRAAAKFVLCVGLLRIKLRPGNGMMFLATCILCSGLAKTDSAVPIPRHVQTRTPWQTEKETTVLQTRDLEWYSTTRPSHHGSGWPRQASALSYTVSAVTNVRWQETGLVTACSPSGPDSRGGPAPSLSIID